MKITLRTVFLSLLAAPAAWAELPPGTVDLSFDAGSTITRPVNAAALLGDGRVFIAGDFTSANGTAANGAALLNANGTTATGFTNGLQGLQVMGRAAAVQLDGKLLVGGAQSFGWYSVSWLRRLNPDGSLDQSFPSPVSSFFGVILSLAVQPDGKVLVAGSFTASGRGGLFRLNTDGTLDNSFLYGLSGANNTVYSVKLLSTGKILIGGTFTTVNGIARPGVARLNADGSLDQAFSANVSSVYAVASQTDGKVVIGGNFTIVNGAGLNRLARLNADGSLDTTFLSGLSGADKPVRALSIQSDGKVLAGGDFTTINGSSIAGLTRLTTAGAVDGTFSNGSIGGMGLVRSLTQQPNGQWIITGDFTSVGGVARNYIARLGTSGSLDSSFANGPVVFSGPASCVVTQADGKILVNSIAGKNLGRFNTNGVRDTGFLGGLSGANASVSAIAVTSAGKILVGGQFSQFNSFPARALVRLDSGGAIDPAFQNGIGGSSGTITCLLQQPDGRIIIGGDFTSIKGIARANIARLNADGSLDNTFQGAMSGVSGGPVLSLALQSDGKLLVGGVFTAVNGVARANIARLNADGSLDRTFQEGMAGADDAIYAIAVQPDQRVVVGGAFGTLNGYTTWGVGRLEKDGTADTNFFADTYWNTLGVRALALQPDGRILIAGDITGVANVTFNNIARLRTNGVAEAFLQSPQGAGGPVTALVFLDQYRLLLGGEFGSVSGAARSYLATLIYNAPSVPLDVALNGAGLVWTNDPVSPWRGQSLVTHDGIAAAQSDAVGDSESSTLGATIAGPGCLSFWWKVSSETNYDYLTFTCTGPGITNTLRISGEVDWEPQTLCVGAGVYTLQWTYSKDVGTAMGMDAAFVDEVSFTPGNFAPLITLNPLGGTNNAGDTVSLSGAGAGQPPLSYQWLLNGSEIPGATNALYTIGSVLPEQAGSYTLRVANAFGASLSASAQLVIVPVRAMGAPDYGQSTISLATLDSVAVAAGQYHSMILRRDGSIYAWGNDGSGQCRVPAALGPATAIAAGGYHSLAVRANGTVAGWGNDGFHQTTPPAGLTNVIAVAAGLWHSLALRQDGTVIGWGDNSSGQATPPPGLSNVVALAAGGAHSLALRADGTVVGWGNNLGPNGSYTGQAAVPWGLKNVVAIGAGGFHSVVVKNDGSIFGWGDNTYGQLTVITNLPPAVAVTCGGAHTVAVFSDGTAAAWGENFDGQCNISRTLTNVVAAAAGQSHTLLLFGQRPPPPEAHLPGRSGPEFSVQVATYSDKLYALEYKPSLTASNWVTLPAIRGTGHTLKLTDPTATAPQRYYRVRQW